MLLIMFVLYHIFIDKFSFLIFFYRHVKAESLIVNSVGHRPMENVDPQFSG